MSDYNDHNEPTEHNEQSTADAEIIERRSLTEVAIVATPVVLLAQPVVGALADKYIGQKPSDPPPAPQETTKD